MRAHWRPEHVKYLELRAGSHGDTFAPDGTLQLLLAEYQDIPVAGIILLARDNTVHYAYGASNERYLNLARNNLLFWTASQGNAKRALQDLILDARHMITKGLWSSNAAREL